MQTSQTEKVTLIELEIFWKTCPVQFNFEAKPTIGRAGIYRETVESAVGHAVGGTSISQAITISGGKRFSVQPVDRTSPTAAVTNRSNATVQYFAGFNGHSESNESTSRVESGSNGGPDLHIVHVA